MNFNIYNQDCVELMKTIDMDSVDLIITDPPYGVDFSKGFDDSLERVRNDIGQWFSLMYRVLKEGSHAYIFVPTLHIDLFVGEAKKHFELKNILAARTYTQSTYQKNNFQFNNQLVLFLHKGQGKPFNQIDFIKTSDSWLKDKRNTNPKEHTYAYPSFLPSDVFANTKSTSNNKKQRHPAEKNTDFLRFLVEVSSNPGDVVLDPFMGGGSTGLACKDREFIGVELNPDYFTLALHKLTN